jgi:spermidine/putrescine transport system permease protein
MATESSVIQKDDRAALGDVVRPDEEMAGVVRSQKLLLGFLPVGFLYGLFFIVPLCVMILYSVWQMEGFNIVPGSWTLKNYRAFIGFNMYTPVLIRTFLISLFVTVLGLLVGYPFAYFLVRHVGKKWQLPLLVLVIIPFWTSYLLRVYAWMGILGRRGLINQVLMGLGIIRDPLEFLLYNNTSVLIVFLYLYLPFVVITLYAILDKFDFNQVDAAMDLGATPMRAFLEITLPQTRQGVITAFIFVFIPMLGEYITPKLVGGTSGTMIAIMIVNLFRGFQFPQGAAVALSIAAFIVVLLFVFRRYIKIEEMY